MTAPLSNSRQRLDHLLVQRAFYPSRSAAVAAIAAGFVRVGGEPARKPSQSVAVDAVIEAGQLHPYVSRGGVKLAAALDAFQISPAGRCCLDLGASTGGFTDCLIQRGADRVYAVDVGHGQLHPRLKADRRVIAHEGLDARAISATHVPEYVDLLVGDLSFIGLAKALPAALARLADGGDLVLLVKPQFEAGPGASKDGVIRDIALQEAILARVSSEMVALGLELCGQIDSPIAGGDGNREFLLHARKPSP